jgi:transcriptional regulator with XRE-family HTH domain
MLHILADNKPFSKIIFADCQPNGAYTSFVDIKREFAKRLREALLDRWPGERMQSVWAKSLNVSAPTLSEWLNGLKMPGTEKLIEICLALDVGVEWLATGKGDKLPIKSQKKEPKLTEEQKKILKEIIGLICD